MWLLFGNVNARILKAPPFSHFQTSYIQNNEIRGSQAWEREREREEDVCL